MSQVGLTTMSLSSIAATNLGSKLAMNHEQQIPSMFILQRSAVKGTGVHRILLLVSQSKLLPSLRYENIAAYDMFGWRPMVVSPFGHTPAETT